MWVCVGGSEGQGLTRAYLGPRRPRYILWNTRCPNAWRRRTNSSLVQAVPRPLRWTAWLGFWFFSKSALRALSSFTSVSRTWFCMVCGSALERTKSRVRRGVERT